MTPGASCARSAARSWTARGSASPATRWARTGALRFPDLDGHRRPAPASRIAGLSDVEYLAQSLYEPDKFIVPGFNPGMPVINKPPIGLTDDEILRRDRLPAEPRRHADRDHAKRSCPAAARRRRVRAGRRRQCQRGARDRACPVVVVAVGPRWRARRPAGRPAAGRRAGSLRSGRRADLLAWCAGLDLGRSCASASPSRCRSRCITLYMAITTGAIVAYVTSSRDRLRAFTAPARAAARPSRGCAAAPRASVLALPALAAFGV